MFRVLPCKWFPLKEQVQVFRPVVSISYRILKLILHVKQNTFIYFWNVRLENRHQMVKVGVL